MWLLMSPMWTKLTFTHVSHEYTKLNGKSLLENKADWILEQINQAGSGVDSIERKIEDLSSFYLIKK